MKTLFITIKNSVIACFGDNATEKQQLITFLIIFIPVLLIIIISGIA